MKRIICTGNRYYSDDAAGARVYERLSRMERPSDVEVIDGGLAGLDLLRFIEPAERVVFVDAVLEADSQSGILVLSAEDIAPDAAGVYGHSSGLPYLLGVLPSVADGPLPEILVVGIAPDAGDDVIDAAANLCLSLAAEGNPVACGADR